jgi:hypothetical protein
MVESNTAQGTGMFSEADETDEGPFWNWDFGDRDDHWEFLVPKRSALALITAKHGVDAKTSEALFFDVFSSRSVLKTWFPRRSMFRGFFLLLSCHSGIDSLNQSRCRSIPLAPRARGGQRHLAQLWSAHVPVAE